MGATLHTIPLLLSVLVVIAVLARRLDTPPSILLVLAGIGLAFIPGIPAVELAPEVVLLGVLPPLIYSAGVAMSWREFRFNLRPIALLAFGCVVFTACAVAVAAHLLLRMPWGVSFALGAIVAPPDAVAPLAIARRAGLPRRILVVLEGEGLANDATALILYRFAVAAAVTGGFSFGKASGTFVALVIGEIAWGILVGWLSLRLRRWAHDPRVEITLSLMTPYLAYWIPEHLGGSGVLATVASGLYVSWNGPLMISSATRLQGIFFWDLVIYLIEGLVFLVTGLQARALVERAGTFSVREVLVATGLTTAILILARFAWVFPSTYVPRWIIPGLARRDPSPPWQATFILAFTGIRGVVSLAAALAIPLSTAQGAAFPYRDQILFVTFGVILATLVGQGLVLPRVIAWLRLAAGRKIEHEREQAAELAAREAAIEAARDHLERLAVERSLPETVLASLRSRHETRAKQLPHRVSSGDDGWSDVALSAELRGELISVERQYLHRLLRDGKITDESRRRLERELDLEEVSIAVKHEGELPT